ncbi:MAG TPA: tetratricopeptide repeat protein [Candidatus Dormibacteraeota bacterium]|nr:tetratricopeptide repeat protein [Candidatus Dormibacteraeota bacterium]
MDQEAGALQRAQLLIEARRYDDALRMLAALPEDGAARYLSAAAYLYKDDARSALKEVETSIALLPEVPEPHALRADVLYDLGRSKDSVAAALEAVRLAPDTVTFQYTLARSAIADGKWKLAETAAQETLRLAPEWAEAHNLLGLVEAKRRRRGNTQARLREALRLDPSSPWVLNNIAATMPRLKPRTEAVRLLEEAVRLDPSNKPIVDNLYDVTRAHVAGAGLDRLDIMLGGPTMLAGVLMVAFILGWIRVPSYVTYAAAGLAVPLIVAYAVTDFVRNRARFRSVRTGTRALYLRRFYRDHWLATAAFVVTFAIPAVVIAIVAVGLGVPALVPSLAIVVAFPVWLAAWPWTKRTRPFRWLTKGRSNGTVGGA